MLSIKSFWKLQSKKLLILRTFDDDREQYSGRLVQVADDGDDCSSEMMTMIIIPSKLEVAPNALKMSEWVTGWVTGWMDTP